MALMEWIIPEQMENRRLRLLCRVVVSVFSGLLLCAMLVGIFLLMDDSREVRQLGKSIVWWALGISAVQILTGILVRWAGKKRK